MFYSVLRYSKILNPTISNIDKITNIPPKPINPKPIESRISLYGILGDTNNCRIA